MKFMLGCNYWGSKYGINMWKDWDAESVRNDLKVLSENGIRCMRVFPNWRDFQPVMMIREWRGKNGGYYYTDDTPVDNEFGLDFGKIEHFREFCGFASEYGIDLVVAILTGWMSGRLFVPPVADGKNLITDPEALMWETRFVRGFVRSLKDRKEIVAWDLGNECNCLSEAGSRSAAYMWTYAIRSAILTEDTGRPVMSGMHALEPERNAVWTIQDQGELTDILCTHPYPSPTVKNDREAVNEMRPTLVGTAQTLYYSGIGGRPAMIQEQGTFSPVAANDDMAAQYVRANLFTSWAHGSLGYFWWCAHEQIHLDYHPYTVSMMERQLGLLYSDFTPKPVALAIRQFGEMLDAMPFETLPARKTEATVILTDGADPLQCAISSFILAVQAGFDVRFAQHDQLKFPETPVYIVPSIRGWAPFGKRMYDFLKQRAGEGCSVYISQDDGHLVELETVMGIRSYGFSRENLQDAVSLGGKSVPFDYGGRVRLESVGAEVLLRASSDGNPVLTRNRYGKGEIYFLNFPLEIMADERPGVLNHPEDAPYYEIYRKIASGAVKNRIVEKKSPYISVTEHPSEDGSVYVVAVNHTPCARAGSLIFKEGWKSEALWGDPKAIDGCDAVVLRAFRQKK